MPPKGFSIVPARDPAAGGGVAVGDGYWSLLTNGDPVSPELIFDADGDVIAVWVET